MLSRQQDVALAAAEVVAIAIVAIAPVPMSTAVLLAVAAAALWLRGAGFAGPPGGGPEPALLGLAVGGVALAIGVSVAAPVVEEISGRAVEWNQEPAVRGSLMALAAYGILTTAGAVCAELVFRGWVASRAASLGAGPIGAVLIAAIAEAAVVGGDVGTRLGAFVLGTGLGALWAGSGQRIGAPLACRLVFELGALLLVATRHVG